MYVNEKDEIEWRRCIWVENVRLDERDEYGERDECQDIYECKLKV